MKNLVAGASHSQVDSILSYCRSNLLVGDLDDALLPFATQNNIGLINASPLHMGMLTEQGAPAWHPAPAAVREVSQQVMQLCRAHGISGSELALRFCLDHPGVTSTLVGMSTRAEVERNLHALNMPLDPALLAQIHALIHPVYNTTWPSGLAENQG